jgi:ribonuclease R
MAYPGSGKGEGLESEREQPLRDRSYWEQWLRKHAEALRPSVATTRDWYRAAGVAKGERRMFRAALRGLSEMAAGRKAGKTRRRDPEVGGTVRAGRLKFTREGRPLVVLEGAGGQAVRIPGSALAGAMPRDRVLVRIDRNRMGAPPYGRVVRVVERGIREFVGRYAPAGERRLVRYRDKEADLLLPVEVPAGTRPDPNDLVLAEIAEYPDGGRETRARILRVLGKDHTMETIVLAVVTARNIPVAFSEAAGEEAAQIPPAVRVGGGRRRVKEAASGLQRVDQRDLPFITIDGEDARDFDDAVCLVREHGRMRLLVAIADVSHYVAPGSSVDRDAYARGTSIYFPDRNIPMLPPALSEGVCSLKPGVNRLSVTVDIPIDSQRRPGTASFYLSVIRSRARLTYNEVHDILTDPSGRPAKGKIAPEVGRMLREMETLAGRLTLARAGRGALDFDLPESKIEVEDGLPRKVSVAPRWESHRIIEEFMLLANTAVAEFLARREYPFLSRIHEPPAEDRVTEFEDAAARLLRIARIEKRGDIGSRLQAWAAAARGGKYEKHIGMLLLRSLMLARYGPEQAGHFGLALAQYTHFTSPIRRFPDLIVHRVLKAALGDEGLTAYVRTLASMASEFGRHLSDRERAAAEAEREVDQRAKALCMASRVGETLAGTISGTTPFGLFVALDEGGIDGFIPAATLRSDVFRYSTERGEWFGALRRIRIALADRVRVRVRRADPDRGEIDLLFVEKIPESF